MTPEDMARLVAAALPQSGWSARALNQRVQMPTTRVLTNRQHAFLLAQCIHGEAEIELLIVDAALRRQGIASDLITRLKTQAQAIFLDVSAENAAALALYNAHNFVETGRRAAYYTHDDGHRVDAVTMKWSNE